MAGIGETYLVADHRESHVLPFIQEVFGRMQVRFVKAQINTGDYLLCRRYGSGADDVEIAACIERKTHKDFADSFKDNRYANREKMFDLREKTGCQLYYFVEGPAFPSPKRHFSRIPYSAILSAMTSLMLRDGVHIVHTENASHTARRLCEFAQALGRIVTPYGALCSAKERPAPASRARAEGEACSAAVGGANPGTAGDGASGADTNAALTVPEGLTGIIPMSDEECAVGMWSQVRGVSVVTARAVLDAPEPFSVAQLALGRVPPARLQALRTGDGKKIRKNSVYGLQGVARGDPVTCAKILSGIVGVSPGMAKHLLEAVRAAGTAGQASPLALLAEMSPEDLGRIEIPQKSRSVRFGQLRASRVLKMLWFVKSERGTDTETDVGTGTASDNPDASASSSTPPDTGTKTDAESDTTAPLEKTRNNSRGAGGTEDGELALAKVKGITVEVARALLAWAGSLEALLAKSEKELAGAPSRSASAGPQRRLGPARASRLLEAFSSGGPA